MSLKMRKYSKSVGDTSLIARDEIITVMDIVLTKMTNAITANDTINASITCHSEKVRCKIDC